VKTLLFACSHSKFQNQSTKKVLQKKNPHLNEANEEN